MQSAACTMVISPPAKAAPRENAMLAVRLALPHVQMAASCFPEGMVVGTVPDRHGAPTPAQVSWKIQSLDLCS